MAIAAEEVTTKLKVDASDFKAGLRAAKDSIALANSEFKRATAGSDDWSKSIDGLSAKIKQLKSVNEAHTKELEYYNEEYKKTVAAEGEASSAAVSLKIKINNLTAEYIKNEKTIDKHTQSMEDIKRESEEAAKGENKLGDEVSETSKELNKSKTKLDAAKDSVKDLGDKSEGASAKFGKFLKGLGKAALVGVGSALAGVSAGIAVIGKQAIEAYSQYEQVSGGVETLFKSSSDEIKKYANDAYKTAGLSANEYMETATGFSASLIQGLGGDTQKAASYADTAITDMSDNANKMGTSIDSIQAAYQGFAKGNFTMLDNLKLGYGGTQSEMLRLINDSGVVKEKVTDINDVSFAQMIDAIHAVQSNMGITGTTAKEASQTIEGSTSAMKSAWQNLLLGISTDDIDFSQVMQNFADSFIAVTKNILPRVKQIIKGSVKLISEFSKTIVPEIISGLPNLVSEILPLLTSAITSIGQALTTSLPKLLPAINNLITQILQTVGGMLPKLLETILQISTAISLDIANLIPQIIPQIVNIIMQIINTLIQNIPMLLDAAIQLLLALVKAIPIIEEQLIASMPQIITSIIQALIAGIPELLAGAWELFKALITISPRVAIAMFKEMPKIIQAIVDGLAPLAGKFFDKISEVINKVVEWAVNVKNTFERKVSEIITAIVNWFKSLPDKVYNAISGAIQKVVQWGGEMKTKAINAASNFLTSTINGIKELPSKVWNIVSNIITKLSGWVRNMGSKGLEGAKSLVNGIKDGLANIVNDVWTVGTNIVTGIWNGIADKAEWLKNQISDWVGNVTDFLKNLFGIHSPSRVMRDQIGKWLPLGMAEGIKDKAQVAVNAMKNVGTKVINANNGLNSGIGVSQAVASSVINNNFTQNNYSPKSLSRLEIYRQSKNLLDLKGGVIS